MAKATVRNRTDKITDNLTSDVARHEIGEALKGVRLLSELIEEMGTMSPCNPQMGTGFDYMKIAEEYISAHLKQALGACDRLKSIDTP